MEVAYQAPVSGQSSVGTSSGRRLNADGLKIRTNRANHAPTTIHSFAD